MTIVGHVSTGYNGQRPVIRGTGSLSGQVRTASAASTALESWVLSRWQILQFALEDAGVERTVSGKAAAVLMVIEASEAAWGRAEWNFNAFGMHASPSQCAGATWCTEWPHDQEDRLLRAYTNPAAGAADPAQCGDAQRDFARLFRDVRATPEEWAVVLRGELVGLAGVYRRGVWGTPHGDDMSDEAAVSSIFRRVLSTLSAQGVAADMVPAYAPMPEGAIARASATGGGVTASGSGTARRAKGVGGLLLLGLGLAVVFGSKRKR